MHRVTRAALVVGLIIAFLLIAAGGYVWLIALGDKRIESKLAALRQAGEPTSVEELWRAAGAGHDKPKDTRFDDVVAQATEIRKIVENSYAPALMDENGHLTEAGRERVGEAFQKHGKFLELTEQLLENPPAVVPPEGEARPEEHLKWCVRVVQNADVIARMLRYWGLFNAESGNIREVLRAADLSQKLARWIHTYPGTMPCNSALKAEANAIDLCELIAGHPKGAKELEILRQPLMDSRPLAWCARAVVADRALGLNLLVRYPGRESLWTRYRWNQFYLNYLDLFERLVREIQQGSYSAVASALNAGGMPPEADAVKMVIPTVRRCVNEAFAVEARRRECLVALAILNMHVQKIPESTEQLLDPGKLNLPKDVVLDPYSGTPFHVLTANDQCVIYSVGPNQKDEGGQTFQGADDVSFRFAWNPAT
ncbi:hypothetical protein [Thermogutta sp.]|uniref:hypothetical protein n=1 Tax=Thermogutta sp. TaxID=1962930 RepID=UPI00321FFF48